MSGRQDGPRRVAVLVDSAAALPEVVAAEHEIVVVPLWLTVGGRRYRDGDLASDELLTRLDEGVTTAGPSPGDYAAALAGVLERHGAAIVLTVPAAISSSHQSAVLGAEMSHGEVRVVDTGTAAGGEALVALAAARAAARGADLDEVERVAHDVAGTVRLVATIDHLDRLVASGRLPKVAARAAHNLRVNPLFELDQGDIRPLRPAFGREAALDRIVQAARRSRPEGAARLHAVVLHAGAPDDAARVLRDVCDREAECLVGPFSAGMIVHTGPGLVGLAWWWEVDPG